MFLWFVLYKEAGMQPEDASSRDELSSTARVVASSLSSSS